MPKPLDRYNEAIYRGIARLEADLGKQDAIPRTLALLAATLAEIDEKPSPETLALCPSLQKPGPRRPFLLPEPGVATRDAGTCVIVGSGSTTTWGHLQSINVLFLRHAPLLPDSLTGRHTRPDPGGLGLR